MDDLISFLNKIIFNVNGFDFSVIDTILLGFAISFALWQIIFHYYYFLKIYRFKSKVPDPEFCPPVSIVICAKNEKENLRENLSAILEQDYPDFEVVVVNDASWDGTDEI
jgi:cellulose synthase/poly-beta-1,6-N-acetylglucosamine synthase-like glycosyltransferase